MNPRTPTLLMSAVLLVGGGMLAYGQARTVRQASIQPPSKPSSAMNRLERGEYLAHHVAQCVQCHSPRDARGNLVEGKYFWGALIPTEAPFRQVWAFRAPPLAGLVGYGASGLVELLTTGRSPNGRYPLPPMPSFRLTRGDAEAIAAYLESLPPPQN